VSGANHGKPVYKKDGGDSVSVLIYYWDERDGSTFNGWWFGPKVGGDQVWAYNENKMTQVPPASNWKVPWDGQVEPTLQVTAMTAGSGMRGSPTPPPMQDTRQQHESEMRRRQEEARRQEEQQRRQRQEEQRRQEEEQRRQRQEEMKRREEEMQRQRVEQLRRQQEEDNRRREAERQRQIERQRQEEERRRRDEEERRRRQKEREEEQARRDAEMQRRREEEEKRKREQSAALAVRKVIQRVRIATPETYDSLRAELEDVQAQHLDAMGSQVEKVSQEAEKALEQAQQRIDEINKKREEDERRAAEEEKRRKEEAELVERLMKELREEIDAVDAKVKEAVESAKSLETNVADVAPDAMVEAAKVSEVVVESAHESVDKAARILSEKRGEMGDNEAARSVRRDLADFSDRLAVGRRTLSDLGGTVKAAHDKASRKSVALQKRGEQKAEFDGHDMDHDGQLSSAEIAAFSKSVYDFEVPEETLGKIVRILEPVSIDKFQRMRGMVAIAKSEVLARARRAEEEEKKRLIEERQKFTQGVISAASEMLMAAELTVGRAESEARTLSKSSDLPAAQTKTIAVSIGKIAEQAETELAEALAKLKQVEEACATDEALTHFGKRDIPRLKQRHARVQDDIEKATASARSANEKATRKSFAELEQIRTKTVTAIRNHMTAENKTGEELFEGIDGGEPVTKDKFVAFISGLGDACKLTDAQAEMLFDHSARGEEKMDKDQFIEFIRFHYTCVKSTVLSETISIKSKTVKRLEVGEVLIGLEGPTKDEGVNVIRVRCQAANDDAIGWATIAGNQGTPFLEPGGTFFAVVKETVLTDGFSVQDSKTIRRITKGEVVEVVEFGKKDASVGVKRIKGRAALDGALGWITISGNQGTSFLEPC